MYRKISFTAVELVKSQIGDTRATATPVLLYVIPVVVQSDLDSKLKPNLHQNKTYIP